ncbi:hypothetical protein GN958_ATG01435 [Phytophthora infestans]|uniref:Uncharacterized protein n=1 Tax=Phytophthora infestans TaxID=4787 RepID=A0A8S9V8S9_PHYIN|nr:hypothetical protein GN958_ATG01435 [Phytophthora infestans]
MPTGSLTYLTGVCAEQHASELSYLYPSTSSRASLTTPNLWRLTLHPIAPRTKRLQKAPNRVLVSLSRS